VSGVTNLSSNNIERWLKGQTSSILTPVQAQAQKHRDEMRDAVENFADVGKQLVDNSSREIEKRNMRTYNRARAMNKLARLFTERIRKVTIPEQVSYDNLNRFAQEIQKVFIVTDIDIKNWFPRISPFFIMDRRKFLAVHEKAKITLTVLNDFLTKEYVKTKTFEETFQLIHDLKTLEQKLLKVEAEKKSVEQERLPVERELAELEKRTSQLKSDSPVEQLSLVKVEIKKINKELKHSLRHLQKPFKKLQALALYRGGAGLKTDERNKLNQYLEKPFNALSTEEEGCPLLKAILEKMEHLMDVGKLKLKSDKKRKAKRDINAILDQDSLGEIFTRCTDIAKQEKEILNSTKMAETKNSLSTFQDQIRRLKSKKRRIEAHEAVKKRAYNDVVKRISSHKKAIEKNVRESLNQRIRVF
jgi:hypothetical protein